MLEEATDNRGFKLLHKNERWIIYNLTGLGRKNWRGGYRRMTFGVIWVSAHPTKFI